MELYDSFLTYASLSFFFFMNYAALFLLHILLPFLCWFVSLSSAHAAALIIFVYPYEEVCVCHCPESEMQNGNENRFVICIQLQGMSYHSFFSNSKEALSFSLNLLARLCQFSLHLFIMRLLYSPLFCFSISHSCFPPTHNADPQKVAEQVKKA